MNGGTFPPLKQVDKYFGSKAQQHIPYITLYYMIALSLCVFWIVIKMEFSAHAIRFASIYARLE